MLMVMGTITARAANPIEAIAQHRKVAKALVWLEKNTDWVTQQQIAITEIPAPEFAEAERAAYMAKLLAASGLTVHKDSAGNAIGVREGASDKNLILVVAHLDTVFPRGTDVRVRRVRGRLEAPGISDNGAGLATIAALARALDEASVGTEASIAFCADAGEEGEGNLRGMRELLNTYKGRVRAVFAIDGAATDYVTAIALGSRRFEISVSGPGGHSWSDFGTANPIAAISRGIVEFSRVRVTEEPRTTFNFGLIAGGNSINSIPAEASVKVDIRSEEEAELARLESELRKSFANAVDAEMAASAAGSLKMKINVIGVRPAGKLPANSTLLAAIENVDRYLGNRSRLERSSTDANLPLSQGIPAIAIGGGGLGGGSHSLDEWYDPAGRELGLKRALLAILEMAGVQS